MVRVANTEVRICQSAQLHTFPAGITMTTLFPGKVSVRDDWHCPPDGRHPPPLHRASSHIANRTTSLDPSKDAIKATVRTCVRTMPPKLHGTARTFACA